MIAMSKLEMVKYIQDALYTKIEYMGLGDISYKDAFIKYKERMNELEDINVEYYNTMNRVYDSYLLFKMFSFQEDFLLNKDDFIFSNDLKLFENECKYYSGEKVPIKRVIQCIRNAFNHPDDDAFNISKNGKNFEIKIDDVRTSKDIKKGKRVTPLHIRFNFDYLFNLYNFISKKQKNIMYLGFNIPDDFNIESDDLYNEVEKIYFTHYYFNRKLTDEEMAILKKSEPNESNRVNNSEEAKELLNEIALCKNFYFTEEQKKKMAKTIKQNRKKNPDILKIDSLFVQELLKTIPIPTLKTEVFIHDLSIQKSILEKSNCSFKNFLDIYRENANKMQDRDMFHSYNNMLDVDIMVKYPSILYIDSVINFLCDDEIININGQEYKKKGIRNSLSHGRWYISDSGDIMLFDADTRNINDYNLRSIGKININAFVNWANDYIEKKQTNNKKYMYELK